MSYEMKIAVIVDLKEYLPDEEKYTEAHAQNFVGRFARLTGLPHTPLVKQLATSDQWWQTIFSVPRDKIEDFCFIMDNFMFAQSELI